MSRWHRENPEHYEEFGEPDWMGVVDRANELEPCCVCGEELTRGGRTCDRCKASIEYDRLERESNR